MARPDEYPDWATNDVTLPVLGGANKRRPDVSIRENGVDQGQTAAAQDFNYQFDLISRWIRFLEGEETAAQSLAITEAITEPATPSAGCIMYVDSVDGNLKAKFSDASVVTLADGPV